MENRKTGMTGTDVHPDQQLANITMRKNVGGRYGRAKNSGFLPTRTIRELWHDVWFSFRKSAVMVISAKTIKTGEQNVPCWRLSSVLETLPCASFHEVPRNCGAGLQQRRRNWAGKTALRKALQNVWTQRHGRVQNLLCPWSVGAGSSAWRGVSATSPLKKVKAVTSFSLTRGYWQKQNCE